MGQIITIGLVIVGFLLFMWMCRAIIMWYTGIAELIKVLTESSIRQSKQMKELIELQKTKLL